MRVKRVNAGIRAISEIYSFMVNDNSWWWGGGGGDVMDPDVEQKNFSFYSKSIL